MDDYYALLQVARDASPALIGKAYRRLAKTCHPDLHANDAGLAQHFIRITEAYTVLSDPSARSRYDAERAAPFAADAPGWPQAWPERRQPFGKARRRGARNPAQASPSAPLFTRQDADDIVAVFLAVLRSPVTYCLLIVFLMLCGLREALNGSAPHH